jgi:surface protein
MSYLFREQPTFNDDISAWDVSTVTNMFRMFFWMNYVVFVMAVEKFS